MWWGVLLVFPRADKPVVITNSQSSLCSSYNTWVMLLNVSTLRGITHIMHSFVFSQIWCLNFFFFFYSVQTSIVQKTSWRCLVQLTASKPFVASSQRVLNLREHTPASVCMPASTLTLDSVVKVPLPLHWLLRHNLKQVVGVRDNLRTQSKTKS